MDKIPVSVRLDPEARAALARLVKMSGRPKFAVLRRLILTAENDPNYRRALGELPQATAESCAA